MLTTRARSAKCHRLVLLNTREMLTPAPSRPLSQLSCCSQAVVACRTRLARLACQQGARVRARLPLFIPSKVALRLLPADIALPEPSDVVVLGAILGVRGRVSSFTENKTAHVDLALSQFAG